MSVLVRIPTPLQKLVGDKAEVHVEAATLREAVSQLAEQNADFKTRMLDDSGELRRFVNVYVNEEDVRFLQKLDTPLKDGDEVSIVPAIAGGEVATAAKNSVLVRLPSVMRDLFDGQIDLQVEANSVRELVETLGARSQKFTSRVLDKNGELSKSIVISVGQENVRFLQKLDTPLNSGDEISIVMMAAGG